MVAVLCTEGKHIPHGGQRYGVLDRGLQGRVALLEGVAVVIAHGAAELPVLRTLRAARIACHHSYSPQEGGEGG